MDYASGSNAPGNPVNGAPESSYDVRGLIAILRRRWQVLAASVVSITILVALVVMQMTPIYSATSSVAINTQKTKVVDVGEVMSGVSA
ncbi:MAG: Wzz/FepE/Etk N-terminal domain-containing protein, partial [Rhizorhabdus sp.]